MRHQDVLVLGGTGFVGRRLVGELVAQGRRVRVPTRRRAKGRELLVLPSVELFEADVHDPASLRSLVAGCDAVINLVGILHDTGRAAPAGSPGRGRYGAGFWSAHVELPRMLAAACVQQGVSRLLHVSALGADPNGPSGYLRSKGDGEKEILAGGRSLACTIFRPSVVFGAGDQFLTLFASLAAVLPVLLIGRARARMQPVWVDDLVSGIATALDEHRSFGRSYEICGPRVYTLGELVRFAATAAGHPRPVIGLPDFAARILARSFELLPGPTLLSRDNLRSLTADSIASAQPYEPPAELGLRLAPMEPEASLYLAGMHSRSRFSAFRARARR